jgi:hypothetical protein
MSRTGFLGSLSGKKIAPKENVVHHTIRKFAIKEFEKRRILLKRRDFFIIERALNIKIKENWLDPSNKKAFY